MHVRMYPKQEDNHLQDTSPLKRVQTLLSEGSKQTNKQTNKQTIETVKKRKEIDEPGQQLS